MKFFTKEEAIAYFQEPDEYSLALPLSNLKMVNKKDATLQGYMKILQDSFIDFSQDEIQIIHNIVIKAPLINIDKISINFIKTTGTHKLDIPQTRKDAILLPRSTISPSLVIHEIYHILSRKYNITEKMQEIFGFTKIPPITINSPHYLVNPDCVLNNYSIKVLHKNKTTEVVPYTKKVKKMFDNYGIDIGLITLDGTDIPVKDTNYLSLIPNTAYATHLEEICAEHFRILFDGKATHNPDDKKLELFKEKLLKILKKEGLL